MVIQGRFKQKISCADVYVGQIFTGPLAHQPPDWLVSMLLPIMRTLQPGLKMNLSDADHPYLISPLMSTMQFIRINLPGSEPKILDVFGTCVDDLAILDQSLFANMDIAARKAYFSNVEHLQKFAFDPAHVFTFGFYQHLLNMSNMHIEPMPLVSYDLGHILGPRPIQFMAAILPADQIKNTDTARDSVGSDSHARKSEGLVKTKLEWKYAFDVEICKA